MSVVDRIKNAWYAFRNDGVPDRRYDYGPGYYSRPDRTIYVRNTDKNIVSAIYNRIALDVSQLTFMHANVNDNNQFQYAIPSGLNNCLNLSANLDQTSKNFLQDIVLSMFDEGYIAVVPTITNGKPDEVKHYKIYEMRVAKIKQWYPNYIRVEMYNDLKGIRQETTVPKNEVAIIENPFYSVMNDSNSVGKRLIRKLNLLDVIDEQAGSGKLDMIIQVPYTTHSPTRKALAEERRKDLEKQLNNSKYGVAYADATEKIIQLNRPLENNIMKQVEYLTEMLYSQLGISKEILTGEADESKQLNYVNNTVVPVASAIADEFKRKFLTKTAVTQHQSIVFMRDPFKAVPAKNLAEIIETLSRNEIISPNEGRSIIGYKPIDDQRADELRNRNLNPMDEPNPMTVDDGEYTEEGTPQTPNYNEEY